MKSTSQATFNKYALPNERYVSSQFYHTVIKHNATEVDGVSLVGATTIIVQNTMF